MLNKTIVNYPLTRVEVTIKHARYTRRSGGIDRQYSDNIQLPKRIRVGFVDNKTFNDIKLKPFNFKNYGINFFSLYAEGMQIPSRLLQTNFSKDEPLYVEDHHTQLTLRTGIHFLNESNSVSRNDYANGYTLFAFDFTPDLSANCAGHWNLGKHGSLRLEVRFEKFPWILIVSSMLSLIMF